MRQETPAKEGASGGAHRGVARWISVAPGDGGVAAEVLRALGKAVVVSEDST